MKRCSDGGGKEELRRRSGASNTKQHRWHRIELTFLLTGAARLRPSLPTRALPALTTVTARTSSSNNVPAQEPKAKAQKRTRTRGRSPEAGDFGEVWEIYDYDCIMLWAL